MVLAIGLLAANGVQAAPLPCQHPAHAAALSVDKVVAGVVKAVHADHHHGQPSGKSCCDPGCCSATPALAVPDEALVLSFSSIEATALQDFRRAVNSVRPPHGPPRLAI